MFSARMCGLGISHSLPVLVAEETGWECHTRISRSLASLQASREIASPGGADELRACNG